MTLEVINTGTEILLGSTINSHVAFFGRKLFPLGLRIARQVTVPDGNAIADALKEALHRAEIILITGGLGPTTDDLTREITSEVLGLELEHDESVMDQIRARFARRGLIATERVARQAMVPSGAAVLANTRGTAPGLYITAEHRGLARHLFLLPGPPRELEPMFDQHVTPILRKLAHGAPDACCKTFRVIGLGESDVEARVGAKLLAIEGLELGYCARPGEVEIRCIGTAAMLSRAEEIVRAALDAEIASDDDSSLEEVIVQTLASKAKTLATAESCTGGFLANRLTNVPGVSAVFLEGFITYANEAKFRALHVDSDMLAKHGAVSREVAAAMAEGAIRASGADYALATTGIAGPGGGTEAKPVGTVFIALADKGGATQIEQHKYPTDRETFKWLASQAALDLLRKHLSSATQ